MNTAKDVIERINASYGYDSAGGLSNTKALLEYLQAYPTVPVIHIAGTNGKGSTCAMLNRILILAGYRTGMYSSPFLQEYNERIRINGTPVSNGLIARYGGMLFNAADRLQNGFTPFELGTALAYLMFKREQIQIQVIETGLGGRLDPTNAIPHVTVSGITAIGMDHMKLLGDTMEKIAAEKAGIIRSETPVVCHPAPETVKNVFLRTAEHHQTDIQCMTEDMISDVSVFRSYSYADFDTGHKKWKHVKISLPGRHQLTNALTVLGIIDQLRLKGIAIPDQAVLDGLSTTLWPARLEWCGNILLDGAHNEQGIQALASFTDEQIYNIKKVLLVGVLSEKLSDNMLESLKRITDCVITVTPHSDRAMKSDELMRKISGQGLKVFSAKSIEDGLRTARDEAGTDGIIIATGSLYFVGELRTILGLAP